MEGDRELTAIKVITYVYIYYCLFLTIFGTIGNAFASLICFRKTLQKVSTFRIQSIVFIHAFLTLYTWNLDHFLKVFKPYTETIMHIDEVNIMESFNIVTCKIFAFTQYYSLQTTSWLLMYVSVDQTIKMYIPNIRYSLKPTKVYPICFVILQILFLF
jgi:hypothetical protein